MTSPAVMTGLTRLAPTPSGFLHEGNRANFALTAHIAERLDLMLALRIDDIDAARYRQEYVEDIFDVLHDMGISWSLGPQDARDFEANYRQEARISEYYDRLSDLRDSSLEAYACTCSRSTVGGLAVGGCPGECRTRPGPLVQGESALRIHVPPGTTVRVADDDVDVAAAMGDFVVWRRDGLPAYQLVSVVEDARWGTTHIVRGADLLPSTAAQIMLARALGLHTVADATYVHHALVLDDEGRKLSKSQLTR